MPSHAVFVARDTDDVLEKGFRRVRRRLDVPASFPPNVEAEAQEAAAHGPMMPPGVGAVERVDRRDLELVAIDPPGARDLDQAFFAERTSGGYRVWYAIADVAAFVIAGGAVDLEARQRGVTMYSPDSRASLHPDILNEGAASLLPELDRPAILWALDLDDRGELVSFDVMRAMVTNRASITYSQAQDAIDNGTALEAVRPEVLHLLAEIGGHREAIEAARGAVNLRLPTQEIERKGDSYELVFDDPLPVEGWNAQISLLTGMAAAEAMLSGGIGLLRTLPPPDDYTMAQMRATANHLGIDWPENVGYAAMVRELQAHDPKQAALLVAAARGLRGAGYLAFENGDVPRHTQHAAIAANYAHVTAPLRRVCDRFANEVVLAIVGGYPVPEWARTTLGELPSIMGRARQRAGELERAQLDFAESLWLKGRVGETFPAVVTTSGPQYSTVLIRDPAVIAPVEGHALALGAEVLVRLAEVSDNAPHLVFTPAN